MSLLMDALKRAEESKRLTASKSSAPAATPTDKPELTLKPLTPPESSMAPPSASQPNSPLPELSLHIDAVDAKTLGNFTSLIGTEQQTRCSRNRTDVIATQLCG